MLVPKPGKDHEDCAFYRPISLLNADAKLLAKMLAHHFTTIIGDLIHVDQTGFMPGKCTDINIRCLFLNLAGNHDKAGVVAFLDAEKAFDSVKWIFLWEVLCRFGFGPCFPEWLGMLYCAPWAKNRTNNISKGGSSLERLAQ